MNEPKTNPLMLSIDQVHAELLCGLVAAHKPRRVLEIGYGGGASARAICAGLGSFCAPGEAHYTLVDNWAEWRGQRPELQIRMPSHAMEVITANEEDYVKGFDGEPFDFIMSDGDHDRAHEWADRVYGELASDRAIIVYHDTNDPAYPGLYKLPGKYRGQSVHFTRKSRPYERCDRGLLVIFKELLK